MFCISLQRQGRREVSRMEHYNDERENVKSIFLQDVSYYINLDLLSWFKRNFPFHPILFFQMLQIEQPIKACFHHRTHA